MLIIGAKGFAKELLEAIYQENPGAGLTFFDDVSRDLPEMLYGKYPLLRNHDAAARYFREKDNRFALGIGNPALRAKMSEVFISLGGKLTSVISPKSIIGHFGNKIGEGCTIMSGAVITNDITIGKGSLLNLNVTVGHDSVIGEFCEISPGAHLSGHVKTGNLCSIGTGAVILPGIRIGNGVTIGAGTVVTKDVEDGITLVGVPGKPVKKQ